MTNRRKYDVDEEYFSEVKSERPAYWAGFLLADGNVDKRRRTIQVKLKRGDIDHIRRFKRDIGAENPIYHDEKDSGKRLPSIRSNSTKLVDQLERFGVVPRKSYGHPLPDVPSDLLRHFVRGYFDGDGHVGASNGHVTAQRPQYTLSVTGQPNFIRWVQERVEEHADATPNKIQEHKVAATASYSGNQQVGRICAWMYDGCSAALPRKESVAMRVARLYHLGVEGAVQDLVERAVDGELSPEVVAQRVSALIRDRDEGEGTVGNWHFRPSKHGAHEGVTMDEMRNLAGVS